MKIDSATSGLSRRTFLKVCGSVGLGGALAPSILQGHRTLARATHVEVRGTVQREGLPIEGVRVSDGLQVVRTNGNGEYLLRTSTERPFVFVSVPSGSKIPRSAHGTAAHFRPITDEGRMRADFTLESLGFDDHSHQFIVLADPQTKDIYEVQRLHDETSPDIAKTVAKIGKERLFGVTCGDIMGGDLALLPHYESFASDTGIPMYQVVGNHDIVRPSRSDHASLSTFREHFGPRNYSFDRGEVRYIVLDNVFWSGRSYFGYVDEDQLRWLQNDLGDLDPGSTVILFMHIPMSSTLFGRVGQDKPEFARVANKGALMDLLDRYNAHVVSGHIHENEHIFENGIHEHIVGTVCGAWWSGDVCYDGTPNGYAVYEVNGHDIRWRYKATGQDDDYQMRLYQHATHDDGVELVANVWDADQGWTVKWYEDGIRVGAMEQFTGTDDVAETHYRGEDVPKRRPSLQPVPTHHLYRTTVAPNARIVVEATDRFGRSHAQSL